MKICLNTGNDIKTKHWHCTQDKKNDLFVKYLHGIITVLSMKYSKSLKFNNPHIISKPNNFLHRTCEYKCICVYTQPVK